MSVCAVHHFNSLFLDRPDSAKFPNNRIPIGFRNPRIRRLGLVIISRDAILEIIPRASSASSPVQYPEEFFEAQPEQRRQRIAGMDQDELDDPTLLADPDSFFCEFRGVKIHHKISDPEISSPDISEAGTMPAQSQMSKRVGFPLILLHGFGASVFSWSRVMNPLSQVTSSKVLSFDRPAFGLSSRVDSVELSSTSSGDATPVNPYSTMFSALTTLYFIDFLAAEKAILVGHSAGSLVAVETYFKAPKRVAALILVAPAILAPFSPPSAVKDGQSATINQAAEDLPETRPRGNIFGRIFSILSHLTKYVATAIINAVKGMGDMLNSLYKKALCALLRSAVGVMLVRMIINKFGIPAVRNAWYDSNKVSDHVIQGYTKPLRVKGWDKALVEYTIAMLTDSAAGPKTPLAKRLGEISCPVLIVTGDSDRLVPAWNSERLSRAIPGSSLEIMKNCGHLPQEEKPEEFVSIVEKFLQRVFGTTEQPSLQAVT